MVSLKEIGAEPTASPLYKQASYRRFFIVQVRQIYVTFESMKSVSQWTIDKCLLVDVSLWEMVTSTYLFNILKHLITL